MASRTAALIAFPVLLAAMIKYAHIDHLSAGLDRVVHALCTIPTSSSTTSQTLTYAGYPYTLIRAIDNSQHGPCGLIACFHLSFKEPRANTFLEYFIATGVPMAIIPWVEMYRREGLHDWKILAYPTFWLLCTQFLSIGGTNQVYWLLLALASRPRQRVAISRVEAEALALGLLVVAVPSTAMFVTPHPMLTWAWQFYPVYMAIVRSWYLRYTASSSRPDSKTNKAGKDDEGGRRVLKVIYIATFLLCAGFHAAVSWPYVSVGDFKGWRDLLVVSTISPSETLADGSEIIHSFFRWDFGLGYAATVVGLMLTAKGKMEGAGIFAWCTLATPFIGIGAAVMGVLGWRDL